MARAVGFVVVAENHEWAACFDRLAIFLEHQPCAIASDAVAQLVDRKDNVVVIRRTDERVVFAALARVGHDHFRRVEHVAKQNALRLNLSQTLDQPAETTSSAPAA